MPTKNQGKFKNSPSIITQQFIGPLPPPSVLAQYEEIQPGFAERIIKMAETQGEHRRTIENDHLKMAIEHTNRRDNEAKRGQIFAFIIVMIVIIATVFVALYGYELASIALCGLGLTGIISTFVYGRKNENK
ncbi:MAG TPA: DUF2335 domain-containing protein [Gammaproteobacteria bacterium]|nr:DUF2335 domain-containing protein [Gammaproteobacteria bacterium]